MLYKAKRKCNIRQALFRSHDTGFMVCLSVELDRVIITSHNRHSALSWVSRMLFRPTLNWVNSNYAPTPLD